MVVDPMTYQEYQSILHSTNQVQFYSQIKGLVELVIGPLSTSNPGHNPLSSLILVRNLLRSSLVIPNLFKRSSCRETENEVEWIINDVYRSLENQLMFHTSTVEPLATRPIRQIPTFIILALSSLSHSILLRSLTDRGPGWSRAITNSSSSCCEEDRWSSQRSAFELTIDSLQNSLSLTTEQLTEHQLNQLRLTKQTILSIRHRSEQDGSNLSRDNHQTERGIRQVLSKQLGKVFQVYRTVFSIATRCLSPSNQRALRYSITLLSLIITHLSLEDSNSRIDDEKFKELIQVLLENFNDYCLYNLNEPETESIRVINRYGKLFNRLIDHPITLRSELDLEILNCFFNLTDKSSLEPLISQSLKLWIKHFDPWRSVSFEPRWSLSSDQLACLTGLVIHRFLTIHTIESVEEEIDDDDEEDKESEDEDEDEEDEDEEDSIIQPTRSLRSYSRSLIKAIGLNNPCSLWDFISQLPLTQAVTDFSSFQIAEVGYLLIGIFSQINLLNQYKEISLVFHERFEAWMDKISKFSKQSTLTLEQSQKSEMIITQMINTECNKKVEDVWSFSAFKFKGLRSLPGLIIKSGGEKVLPWSSFLIELLCKSWTKNQGLPIGSHLIEQLKSLIKILGLEQQKDFEILLSFLIQGYCQLNSKNEVLINEDIKEDLNQIFIATVDQLHYLVDIDNGVGEKIMHDKAVLIQTIFEGFDQLVIVSKNSLNKIILKKMSLLYFTLRKILKSQEIKLFHLENQMSRIGRLFIETCIERGRGWERVMGKVLFSFGECAFSSLSSGLEEYNTTRDQSMQDFKLFNLLINIWKFNWIEQDFDELNLNLILIRMIEPEMFRMIFFLKKVHQSNLLDYNNGYISSNTSHNCEENNRVNGLVNAKNCFDFDSMQDEFKKRFNLRSLRKIAIMERLKFKDMILKSSSDEMYDDQYRAGYNEKVLMIIKEESRMMIEKFNRSIKEIIEDLKLVEHCDHQEQLDNEVLRSQFYDYSSDSSFKSDGFFDSNYGNSFEGGKNDFEHFISVDDFMRKNYYFDDGG
ncbi:expressed protein [Phakopsora pachyrhizi]|uniref:Expressed protein n=1 Tax=Phakopsora pachyrhizi TaxID=170000 RepID=A0AAV0BQK0_PHAPC|nr:expressed protein [Phakopsora pachyrhizi]